MLVPEQGGWNDGQEMLRKRWIILLAGTFERQLWGSPVDVVQHDQKSNVFLLVKFSLEQRNSTSAVFNILVSFTSTLPDNGRYWLRKIDNGHGEGSRM